MMARILVRIACLFPLLLLAQYASAATEIRIDSEDGDRMGLGQSFVLNDSNGTLSIPGWTPEDVELAWSDSSGNYWNLRFMTADRATPLAVGLYADAERWVAGSPTLDIFGFNGGCNRVVGEFEIYEIEVGADGLVTKVAIDAVQHCEGDPRSLRAQVRINSDVEFDLGPHVRAEDDRRVAPGDSVSVGLDLAETTNGVIETYSWRQTYGLPVVLGGVSTDTVTLTAPASDSETELIVLEIEVTDSAGETASDRVAVVVTSQTNTQSRIRFVPMVDSYLERFGTFEAQLDSAFLTVVRDREGVQIEYDPPTGDQWALNVSPAKGEELRPGQYHRAFETDKRAHNRPGVEFTFAGVDCGSNLPAQLLGDYKILDLGLADNGAVTRLAVDMGVYCTGLPGLVTVRLRVDSTLPFDSQAPIADPGMDQVVQSGDVVQLDAFNSQNDTGEVESVEWMQLSGPALTLSDPASTVTWFTAPAVAQGEGLAEFSLTVRNDNGRSDTESVFVEILGEDDPKSYVTFKLEPGGGFDNITNSFEVDVLLDKDDGYLRVAEDGGINRIEYFLNALDVFRFTFRTDGDMFAPVPDLSPGLYEYARRDVAGYPHIELSGLGPGCGEHYGSFVVHEYTLDAEGLLVAAAIDYVHSCAYGPPLNGSIRLNSTVGKNPPGLFASAGHDLEAVPDQIVRLDSSGSYIGPTAGVSYEWEQLSGPPVVLSGASAATATFVAPGAPGIAVLRVTITTAEGLIEQATITVTLLGPGVPLTAMIWQSEAGEPLFQGAAKYFNEREVNSRKYSANQIEVGGFGSQQHEMTFSAPNGELLAPGDYVGAHGFGRVPGFPGIDLEYNRRGCISSLGWFRIHEIEAAPNGTEVQKLAVDFWQTCDFGRPAIYGALRVNSTVPLRTEVPLTTAGPDMTGIGGMELKIGSNQSYSWDSSIVSYSWSQISGPAATFVAGEDSGSPTILLPVTSVPSANLVFELTVTNDRGRQSTARTNVTVLAADEPFNQVNLTLFDRSNGEVLEVIEATPNDSYFSFASGATSLTVGMNYRHLGVNIGFDTQNMTTGLEPGLYFNDELGSTNFPDMILGGMTDVYCDLQAPGWLHVLDVQTQGALDSIAFESGHSCNQNFGVRLSGRINTPTRINRGELFVDMPGNTSVVEGRTLEIEDAVAYVEGEYAESVRWTSISGPSPIFDTTFSGRTTFVAPATASNADAILELSVISREQETQSGRTTVRINENGISGFPANFISTETATGTYQASGLPVAIDSDHIVGLYTRAPVGVGGPHEPPVAPFGAFEMFFDTGVGESIEVTMHFPVAVGADARWLSKPIGSSAWETFPGNWSISADRRSVTFELTDDPETDQDFSRNGKIRFSGGLGQTAVIGAAPPPPPPPSPPPPAAGGGGGGSLGLGGLLLLLVFALKQYLVRYALTSSDISCSGNLVQRRRTCPAGT